jgi:hypothetical protein
MKAFALKEYIIMHRQRPRGRKKGVFAHEREKEKEIGGTINSISSVKL